MSYSTLDHFAMSGRLFDAVTEAGVIHTGQNMSNHAPIYCKIKVNALDLTLEPNVQQSRSSWSKASETARIEFKDSLAEKLSKLQLPSCIACSNVNCQAQNHVDEMEEYTLNIMEAMESAGKDSLPTSGNMISGR